MFLCIFTLNVAYFDPRTQVILRRTNIFLNKLKKKVVLQSVSFNSFSKSAPPQFYRRYKGLLCRSSHLSS